MFMKLLLQIRLVGHLRTQQFCVLDFLELQPLYNNFFKSITLECDGGVM